MTERDTLVGTGLTNEEVAARKEQGQQNNYVEDVSKSTSDIIKDNVFTLFNLLNLLIGICLALVGAFSNMAYLAIIVVNVLIGIFQEIHARNLVAKLSLVAESKVTVRRAGSEQELATDELVLDDIVRLQAGEQVPSDMEVIWGVAEVNEALLTGESDLIVKDIGDQLLSGSFLSSGSCYGRVVHVGRDNYATRIAAEAKIHKPIKSELVDSIRKVSKFTSYVIVPLGIILFLEGFFLRHDALKNAVVSSAAALLGMLPKGLVLLISIALATAVIKLAKKQILVQDMHSVETLAHVDVLCLDKTGTITEGKMKIQQVEILAKAYMEEFPAIIGSYLAASEDNNITMHALRAYFAEEQAYPARNIVAFSSERKWGAMELDGLGVVALGAPEKLLPKEQMPEQIKKAQEQGYRVLLVGLAKTGELTETKLPDLTPLAILEIDDPIREQANETLAYLHDEGVMLKVISGDNPITVSNVARRAGLPGYAAYIDLSQVTEIADVKRAVNEYSVFGRVSPQQKQILVQELKDQGHVVAMTGDGVNDVLALREADCSIAMAEGDTATRQIANLVLLESDFTTLPDVLFEGRRVVNNVTKVASVFFIKTIYSFLLSLVCALSTLAFPFVPIQITLIDLAIEGYPAFFLSFESDKRKIKGRFLPTALGNAAVNAALVLANILAVYLLAPSQGWSSLETTTLMYYLLAGVSILAVIQACLPLNALRLFLALTTSIGFYVAAYLFRSILEIGTLTQQTFLPFLILFTLSVLLKIGIESLRKKRKQTKAN